MNAIFEQRNNPAALVPFCIVVALLIGGWCFCSYKASVAEREAAQLRRQDRQVQEDAELKVQASMYKDQRE